MQKKSEHAGFDTRSLFTVKSGEKSKHEYLLTIPILSICHNFGSVILELGTSIQGSGATGTCHQWFIYTIKIETIETISYED